MYNKIRLSSYVKNFMKPYIIRNGGWVTPKLDNILEKATLDQLLGQLVKAEAKAQNPIMTPLYKQLRYLIDIYILYSVLMY